MKSIILSVHPEHINKILSGKKFFDYRKKLPKGNISHVVLYATSPICMAVAIASVKSTYESSPQKVWEKTEHGAGISRKFFNDYFKNHKTAYAIEFDKIETYNIPLSYKDKINSFYVPQSFAYIKEKDRNKFFNQPKTDVKSKKTIFLGGVHGVGKSTMVDSFFSSVVFYHCCTASSIIKQYKGEVNADKSVEKIDDNQTKLIKGVNQIREEYQRLLIDGHFCLKNKKEGIEKIPADVFSQLNLSAIIVLELSPKEILKRLHNRGEKDFTIPFIEKFQKMEIEHAQSVAKKLVIPCFIIQATKKEGAKKILRLFKDGELP